MELVRGTETAGVILLVEQAEQVGAQEDFPNPGWLALQSDDFPAEGPPDEPLTTLPKKSAIGTDAALIPRGWIAPSRQLLWQEPLADPIMLGGGAQAQRFVWPDLVIVGSPAVGAPLVCTRMSGGVGGHFGLINAVHLFMRGVVFRMRRPAKLDPDTQPPPPDREARKPAWTDPTKGRAVIHADDFGQAVPAKHAGQRAPGVGVALVGQEPDCQEETALEIARGQRFDARAVAGAKPAFEIKGPNVVGRAGGRAWAGRQRRTASLMARAGRHQFEPAQPAGERPRHGQVDARMQLAQTRAQFTRSPSRLVAAESAQRLLPARCQLPGRVERSAGSIPQSGATVASKTMQPFVTRGAGDMKTVTELSKGFASRQSRQRETFTGGNQGASEPRHALSMRQPKTSECPRCLVTVPQTRAPFPLRFLRDLL